MPLEGAYLYCNQKIEAKPTAHLSNDDASTPFAVVSLGPEWSGTYIRVHSADVALTYMQAFFQAWRLLNPDGPLDALMAELLDEPDLAKILAAAHAAPDTAQPESTAPPIGCSRCGATTTRLNNDGECWEPGPCADLQAIAARLDDTAQPEDIPEHVVHRLTVGMGNACGAPTTEPGNGSATSKSENVTCPGCKRGFTCARCGEMDVPLLDDGTCHNSGACAGRQAAKATAR